MRGGAGTEAAGGVDELALAQRQCLAADDPADVGPAGEPDDRDDHDDAQGVAGEAERTVRDHAGQCEREQQDREREEDVHGAADQRVDPAAVVAGDDSRDGPDDHGEEGRQECDEKGDACAVDDTGEDVAPVDGFDPEEELTADPAERSGRDLQVGSIWS